jgi:hypothetical protein
MGRTVTFYVLKIDDKHEKTNDKYCFDVECYGDREKINEIEEELDQDKKLFPKGLCEQLEDLRLNPEYDPKNNKAGIEILKKNKKLMSEYFKNKDLWCSKCFRNINGYHFDSITVDCFDIGHSYSNRIWWSNWNIKDFYLGSETYYTRTLRNDYIYREITKKDIQDAYEKLDRLGDKDMLYFDIEAKEESIRVLEFLSKYADDNNVRMIIEDEY